jgi:hypothetical protein
MKRDDDYLRELLFRMEEHPQAEWIHVKVLSPSQEEYKETSHIDLLIDAGFVVPVKPGAQVVRLTNKGHDFIAAIRDDTTWSRTKEVASKAGTKTLGVLAEVAIAIGKEKVKELTGFDLA